MYASTAFDHHYKPYTAFLHNIGSILHDFT